MSPLSPSDESLDQQLRDVALPDGLLDRLQQALPWTDADLDMELALVPVPPGVLSRLQRLAHTAPSRRWERFAVAASLMLAIGLSYGGALATYLGATYRTARETPRDWLDTFRPPDAIQFTAAVAVDPLADAKVAASLVDVPAFAEEATPQIELAAVERQPPVPIFPSPFPSLDPPHPSGRTAELNVDRFGADLLGSSQREQDLPEWRKMPPLVPRGIESPRSPGFDLAFLQEKRFHPVVVPASAKELASTRVPLAIGQESFLLSRRFLQDGELPPSEMVRTEEFLAAVNYGFPRPRESVGLHVAGGPSPLGGPRQLLLQVGVRAGDLPDARRMPAHLIVCVDVSDSMQRGARLEMVQAALNALIGRLQGEDRVTLIAAGRDARVLIEQARKQDATSLLEAIDALETQSSANPVAGLWLAYGVAAEGALQTNRTQHVVLLSNSLIRIESLTTMPLETYLRGGAGSLARLWLLDLGQSQVVPEHWTHLAQAGGGRVQGVGSSEEIRWTLLEALTGKSQRVASNVSVSVWFNPQAVAGYRLLGHEPTLVAARPATELFAAQTALGLYELQLKPNKPADHVATVTLTWRDSQTGQPRTQSHPVTQRSFAKTFASEPASLQLATLAAEAAELLRRSPFREASSFQHWKKLAAEASAPTANNESFEGLVRLVRQAERARPTSQRSREIWNRDGAR